MDFLDVLIEIWYQFLLVFAIYGFLLSSYFPITNKPLSGMSFLPFLPATFIGVIGAYVASEYGYFYYRTTVGIASIFVIAGPIYFYFHRLHRLRVAKELEEKYGKQSK
ncbi:hypothetical protein [Shewanella aestuarii]|uniref:Uncharacterized protein n=1 Tax=Shewanella aestuarii TaxID=1028752 RepID=A0A6G9QPJ2_9GAMM|nr:hypothetical protein [Shewanella aestuarii]QIR16510.1 hypothetical protein HBH39_18715 [Shewanella aestuarii]